MSRPRPDRAHRPLVRALTLSALAHALLLVGVAVPLPLALAPTAGEARVQTSLRAPSAAGRAEAPAAASRPPSAVVTTLPVSATPKPRQTPRGTPVLAALEAALRLLLAFIGPRELVGYHIAYDLRILNLACQRCWGLTLAQRGIEVSRLYHDHLYRRYPDAAIDLHLAAISSHLGLPALPAHDALSDAITAALIFLRLTRGGPLAYPKV